MYNIHIYLGGDCIGKDKIRNKGWLLSFRASDQEVEEVIGQNINFCFRAYQKGC